MLTRFIFWIFVVFSLLLAHTVQAETSGEKIGTIVEIEGAVTITPPGGKPQPAKIQDEIGENDTIATGPDSRAFILLIDDTEWTLSENTRFKVSDYVFNPDDAEDNSARYSVLEGAFRYVSGLIARKPDPDVNITTPVGSIGIRGTDFWGGPEASGEYGVFVDEGSVNVKTMGGETLLKRGEGSTVKGRDFAPGRAQVWKKERVERMRGTVHLKRMAEIKERRLKIKERHKEMREKYREAMKGRFQKLREKRGNRREKMRELKENRQEKLQDFKQNLQERRGQLQQNRQQKVENWQAQKGQWQQNQQERKENRQEKKEEWQENSEERREQWLQNRPLAPKWPARPLQQQ